MQISKFILLFCILLIGCSSTSKRSVASNTAEENSENSAYYKVELFFHTHNAPFLTDRQFEDRFFVSENDWEFRLYEGAVNSKRDLLAGQRMYSLEIFDLKNVKILGTEGKKGRKKKFHRMLKLKDKSIYSIALVEVDGTFPNPNDFYFLRTFRLKDDLTIPLAPTAVRTRSYIKFTREKLED